MTIENVPFATVSWEHQPVVPVPGESGLAQVRTVQAGAICLRMVAFTPGYRADHWCSRGHVVLVLSGALTTVLQDGRVFETTAGSSFPAGEEDGCHRAETQTGAAVFIVD